MSSMKLFLLRYVFFYFVLLLLLLFIVIIIVIIIIIIIVIIIIIIITSIIILNVKQSFPLVLCQPTFTCSKLKTETLEQGVKYVQI